MSPKSRASSVVPRRREGPGFQQIVRLRLSDFLNRNGSYRCEVSELDFPARFCVGLLNAGVELDLRFFWPKANQAPRRTFRRCTVRGAGSRIRADIRTSESR